MTIFQQQNLLLKIFATILALLITTLLELNNFCLLWLITLAYLCLDFRLFAVWLKLISKLLPLFSSLLLVAILLPVELSQQIVLIAKISYLLLLSIYITKTSRLSDLVYYRKLDRRLDTFIDFVLITLNFIPIFYLKFSEIYQQRKNILETFTLAIKQTYQQRGDVWEKSLQLPAQQNPRNCFWSLQNNILWIFISLQIILFSVKF